jgi:Na+-driven multidrug efflux pump
MRKKHLVWNTISSFSNQLIAIICGFILPRLILQAFGSDVNGLVSSITQFLSVISFMDMGVGAVVESALYKPLAEQNADSISGIVWSANRFFRRIACIMLGYIVVLIFVYPQMIGTGFDPIFIIGLILAMSINSFAQYYYGIVNQLLLNAAQQKYIVDIIQSVTLIINTIVCSILILMGQGIIAVKLTTSIIFLLRPVLLSIYVKRHFHINHKIKVTCEPIKQKWNGLAQHIAAVVLDGTDTIVLTIFSTLSNVSIYAVYHLVVYGSKNLFLSLTGGIQSLFGDMIAKQENEKLNYTFGWVEWAMHSGVTVFFGCVAILIMPFVQVYTKGITDTNYTVPLFAVLITIANAAHCLRLPYNIIVLAGGHYKQTQSCYIIAAVLNIIVSVLAVKTWGLVGVAIGTLLAMGYQTLWLAYYDSKHIIYWPIKNVFRQFGVDLICIVPAIIISLQFKLSALTYAAWIVLALKVVLVWVAVFCIVNSIFFRDKLTICIRKFTKKDQTL